MLDVDFLTSYLECNYEVKQRIISFLQNWKRTRHEWFLKLWSRSHITLLIEIMLLLFNVLLNYLTKHIFVFFSKIKQFWKGFFQKHLVSKNSKTPKWIKTSKQKNKNRSTKINIILKKLNLEKRESLGEGEPTEPHSQQNRSTKINPILNKHLPWYCWFQIKWTTLTSFLSILHYFHLGSVC